MKINIYLPLIIFLISCNINKDNSFERKGKIRFHNRFENVSGTVVRVLDSNHTSYIFVFYSDIYNLCKNSTNCDSCIFSSLKWNNSLSYNNIQLVKNIITIDSIELTDEKRLIILKNDSIINTEDYIINSSHFWYFKMGYMPIKSNADGPIIFVNMRSKLNYIDYPTEFYKKE